MIVKPIGILTVSSGEFVEIRKTNSFNSDQFLNQYHTDLISHTNDERIPERFVHAKGGGAFGYFEVTHDVTKYVSAELFDTIGKKTPLVVRFSTVVQNLGGNDLAREVKGMAIKLYTQEGNLDFLCLNYPVFFYRDPLFFTSFSHSFKRNPKTFLLDFTMSWDFVTKRPDALHSYLWLLSDYGIPNGYRKMDAFPIHTYRVYNKHGDTYFVRFNFRTEQGVENLPSDVAAEISSRDLDYFNRDLFNAIENKTYPSWRLDMDIMTFEDVKNVDYNPFDVGRLWKEGTYFTETVGRLVLDRNPDNYFRAIEQSAFNPANLVPGIPGPMDTMFRSRRQSYRDAQIYRLGVNHNRIKVNQPLYYKGYNRDGVSPLKDNMKDAPTYYPNRFSGPVPYVDPNMPKEKFKIYETTAVDLEPAANFYNNILKTDDQRERLANNSVARLITVSPELQRRVIRLFSLAEPDLGRRVERILVETLEQPPPPIQPSRVLKVPPTMYAMYSSKMNDENQNNQFIHN
ncbi:catalase-like [Danaus plexippus]|uniref:catalase-like n=1 Tax=Danaus plexippus TaxID=13037 RepID=UPI002AB0B000|nr:catalase-like [Danaus plexippus]